MRFKLVYVVGCLIFGVFSCTSDQEAFWEVESRTDDKKKRKRVLVEKVNTDFQGGSCTDCIDADAVLSLRFANEYLDEADLSCTMKSIEILSVEVMNNLQEVCYQTIASADVSVAYSRTDTLQPPFDLLYKQKAKLEIPIQCSSITFNGEKGSIILSYQFLDCEQELLVVADTLEYEIGCPDIEEDDIFYDNHSTHPNASEHLLADYVLGEYSIFMRGQVSIQPGGQTYFKVCDEDEGFIKVAKDTTSSKVGIKVEKGAFFKAKGSKTD